MKFEDPTYYTTTLYLTHYQKENDILTYFF